jgi:hypothetical protein
MARRPIGSFGNEIMRLYPFVIVPILAKDIRPTYTKLFEQAIAEGIKSLKILKEEFCEKENMDISKAVNALGELEKHGYKLYEARANVSRLRLPIPVPSQEQE